MTMALALEFTQEWFREKYGWKWNECGVQFQSIPAYSAGAFFVSIDDGGVEAGRDDTESLMEVLSINIGIWRRREHLMKDQLGNLKLPQDNYLVGAKTIHYLERQVILNKWHGLHKNYVFMTALNERYELPSPNHGANFHMPFVYRGRGSMETQTLSDSNGSEQIWYGYRLRFRGLAREQVLHQSSSSSYVLG